MCLDRYGIAVLDLGVEMVVLLVELVVASSLGLFTVFGLSSRSSPHCIGKGS